MLARQYRFHGRKSLQFVLTQGRTYQSNLFRCRYIANPRQPNYRLAIIVSRKVDKRAVVRNRIRRRLYELFRLQLQNYSPGVDIAVIVLQAELATSSPDQLQTAFEPLWQQLKLVSAQT